MDKIAPLLVILKEAIIFVARWIQIHNGFVSATATAVIAAFTVTLWLTNRKLWKVSLKQSDHMETSLKIAKESSDAAKQSADALAASERAHVFAKVKPINKVALGDSIIVAQLHLHNLGKTPATIIEIAFKGDKLPNPPSRENLPDPHPPLVSFIGSNEEPFEDSHMFSINEFEWNALIAVNPRNLVATNPAIKFYCFGYVKYITIFDQEEYHSFCWEFAAPIGKFALSPDSELNYDTKKD
ncbi:MAG: hypothetical protein WCD80_11255 [Desulfobaccales bacterium]